jgi:spermidine synthase
MGIKGEMKLDPDVAARNLKYAQRSKNMSLLDHRLFYNLIVSENLKALFGDGPIHTENRPFLEFAAPKLLHTDDPAIRWNIAEKSWLGRTTSETVRETRMNVDRRIDFAQYALSVHCPDIVFQNGVSLSGATPGQRERLSDLAAEYCKSNVVKDVYALSDRDIRERCVAAQMALIKTRMAAATSKEPYIRRLGELSRDTDRLDDASGYFSELVTKHPDDLEAQSDLGTVLAALGRYDEAIAHQKTAIKLAPAAPGPYNNLGCTLAERGKPAEAMEYFSESLKRDPEFVDAHCNMGKALVSLGRLDEGVRHLTEAIRIMPGYTDAHYNLADALMAQGEADRAAYHYAVVVRLEPNDPLARNGLGRALAAAGRTKEAVEQLSKAVELDPDFVDALNQLAWTLATNGDPGIRDGSRALSLARHACDLTGNRHPLLLDTLAAAYAETGEFDLAKKTASNAVEIARSAGRTDWAREIEKRLELYDRGKKFDPSVR